MPIDAPKPMPTPPHIAPEILDAVIHDIVEGLPAPAAIPPDPPPVPESVIPAQAEENLLASHPDYDDWLDMKKAQEETLQEILHPTDPLVHVPVIEVREGGSNDEGIAGDDWHEAVEEPTTHSRPLVEPDAEASEEK